MHERVISFRITERFDSKLTANVLCKNYCIPVKKHPMASSNVVEDDTLTCRLVRICPPKPSAENSSVDHLSLLTRMLYAEMVRFGLIAKNGPYPASTMLPITQTEHRLYMQYQKAKKRILFLCEDYEDEDSPTGVRALAEASRA